MGYIACVLIQTLVIFTAAELYCAVMILTIGCCFLMTSLVFDLKENLCQFNASVIELKFITNSKKKRKAIAELYKKLKAIFKFHAEARELSICSFFGSRIFI